MPGRRVPAEVCAKCKGYKRLCGLPSCPILERFRAQVYAVSRVKGEIVEGDTPPSLLVGEEGYPEVRVYLQVPPGARDLEARLHDDPVHWSCSRMPLRRILELRSRMVSGYVRVRVQDVWRLYECELSVAAVSEKPVDTELLLAKRPTPRLIFDGVTAPRGPSAPARAVRVSGNPRPPKPIEKRVFDDMLAEEAVWEAYKAGVDYYTLIRAFSAGLMGRLRDRKLVPTRWAITAVDSIISRKLRRIVSKLPWGNEILLYKLYYLGNRFLVLMKPGAPRIHMLEVWHPATPWVPGGYKPIAYVVTERPSGEPSEMDGGYMAAKLALLEAMAKMNKSYTVVVVREILPEYYAPVGNWHIRETLRKLPETKPLLKTSNIREAINAVLQHIDAKEAANKHLKHLVARLTQETLDTWLTSTI